MSQRSHRWECRKRNNYEKPSRGISRRLSCVHKKMSIGDGDKEMAAFNLLAEISRLIPPAL